MQMDKLSSAQQRHHWQPQAHRQQGHDSSGQLGLLQVSRAETQVAQQAERQTEHSLAWGCRNEVPQLCQVHPARPAAEQGFSNINMCMSVRPKPSEASRHDTYAVLPQT